MTDEHENYSGTYIIVGPPGCGKTRTLSGIVAKIMRGKWAVSDNRSPVLVCSLTKTAAQEIAGRVDLPDAAVATIHAHAFRTLTPQRKLASRKDLDESWNKEFPGYKLSGFADTQFADQLDKRRGGTPGDEFLAQYDLLRNRMEYDRMSGAVKHFAVRWEAWKREHGLIDFTDMLTLADEHPPMGARFLVVDEAQDTSKLALHVLQRWAKHCTAAFYVGDPWQCLYQWAGACPEFLTDPDIPADHRAVLAQSYRVPRLVHQFAVHWVKRRLSSFSPIEYFPRRTDPADKASDFVSGDIQKLRCTYRDLAKIVHDAKREVERGRTVMICASANFIADRIAKDLKKRHVVFANPWRPANAAWNPLTPATGTPTLHRIAAFLESPWSMGDLQLWLPLVKCVLKRNAKKEIDAEAARNPARHATVAEIASWFAPGPFAELEAAQEPGDRLKWLRGRLSAVYARRADYPLHIAAKITETPFWSADELRHVDPRIFVGTIHSFKGAEADVVYIFPDLTKAMAEAAERSKEDRDAIVRTFYVGFTRARHKLVLCNTKNWTYSRFSFG